MTRLKNRKLIAGWALPVLALGLLIGCSTDSPTAPQQQPSPPSGGASASWLVTVTVSPDVVEVRSANPVTVSVDVRRRDNNLAPATGTTIVLSTSLGEFTDLGSGISSIALVTVNGRAQALLFPGAIEGTALLTAQLETSAGQSTLFIRDQIVPIEASFSSQNSESNLSVLFQDTSTGDPTKWRWDFGDGQTSREQNPSHLFELPGDYVVTLTASNSDSSDTTSQLVNVTLDPEFIIAASFETTIDALTVVFRDTSTGSPNRWQWNFGDGTSSAQQNPTKTYRREGSYVVTLTASNSESSDEISQTVTVAVDPDGVVEASFETAIDSLTVVFRDTSIGEPNRWRWTFGDGTSSAQQNPTKTYSREGSYVVTLTASNSRSSSETSQTVTVSTDPFLEVSARFTKTVDGLTVVFLDTSTGDPTQWSWDFGDGSTSNARNPTHTYAAPGTYVVVLTASNSTSSDTASEAVTVDLSTDVVVAANFTPTKNGLTVVFQDTSQGNPTQWQWDFGDGSTSNVQHPTYTYGAVGSYVVVLTASNASSSDSASQTITLP